MIPFSAQEAFERNLGLITPEDQKRLAAATVAIAGCGGVGGLHAHALARLGIGGFRLADFDTFSVANFNRQIGATMETVGQSKVAVTAAMVRSINPDARLDIFPDGVTRENLDAFIGGASIFVDGLDFFVLDTRRLAFAAARRAGVPAVTSGPLGFGATLHVFVPNGMSFDEYFDLQDGGDPFEQLVAFAVGLAPAGLHVPYLDYGSANPATGRGPSSIVGTQMAACLVATECVRLLLGRGLSRPAPAWLQFDAYRQILRKGRLASGNRGLLQRIKRIVLLKRVRALGWERAVRDREAVSP